MARPLRIQYPGATYHVINRGNYRAHIFASVGAAQAFESVLEEACETFGWRVHAYVILRNHFHLALETPEPNLVDGMHWLQSTYGTRFNRYRHESGHLFQGRYQALVIEDAAALSRVVDYIHLNPVRAKMVPVDQIDGFRWSSLGRFRRRDCPKWLVASRWLTQLGLADDADGWRVYVNRLAERLAADDPLQEHQELCCGWTIGTLGWRRALARDHEHLALAPGIAAQEAMDLKHARWAAALELALRAAGRTPEALQQERKGAAWKRDVAAQLRSHVGASHRWLAENLHMGTANSVRAWVNGRQRPNMQISA